MDEQAIPPFSKANGQTRIANLARGQILLSCSHPDWSWQRWGKIVRELALIASGSPQMHHHLSQKTAQYRQWLVYAAHPSI